MAGSLQPRVKTWVATEDVVYSDLNAEFDNVLAAMVPTLMDDYSASVSQMQTTADPGEDGTESLATSLAGEIARLRFAIQEIKGSGVNYWYENANTSLSDLRQLVGGSTAQTRIGSGYSSGQSSQLRALIPDGTNDGFRLEASSTNFIYYIQNIQYTLSSDVTVDGISKAPASNNTCLVNDSTAADGQETRLLGEHSTVISVDNMGSEIVSLVGKVAGFKVNNGSDTEYFTAYVESSTKLTHARRGGFVDSSALPIPRIAFSNNDTITLMKLTHVFVTTGGALAITYNEPVYSATQPTSSATGDYWYDLVNNQWNKFNGTSYEDAAAIYIGQVLLDATNCIAARTEDQFENYTDLNTLDLERISNTEVQVKNYGGEISVFGTLLRFGNYRPRWDITLHLDSNFIEASSTTYYLYLKETGAPFISPLAPHDRKGDRKGYYHPTETWRCVGSIQNDGSSNFNAQTLVAYVRTREAGFWSNDIEEVGSMKMQFNATPAPGWLACEGSSVSRFFYNELYSNGFLAIGDATGTVDSYHFSIPSMRGNFARGWDHGSGNDPDAASRVASNTGGATGDNLGTFQDHQFASHTHTFADALQGNGVAGSGSTTGANTTNTTGASGGNETRPRNIATLFVIKALA